MSKKIKFITFLLFSAIGWVVYTSKKPNFDMNQPLSFLLTKIDDPFMCSNKNSIWLGSTDYKFYLVKNYKGDYKDLKTIYQHIKENLDSNSTQNNALGENNAQWYRYNKDICDDTKGDVFYYKLSSDKTNAVTINLEYLSYYGNVDQPDKYTPMDTGNYVLQKQDISVEDFVQWVSWVKEHNTTFKMKLKTDIGDYSNVTYNLYNQSRTQHVGMHCNNWCQNFELNIE